MGRRRLLRWLIGGGIVVGVVVLFPFLVPSGVLAPRVESLASDRLGVPVRIGTLRLHLLPLPHLRAHDVLVGKSDVAVSSVAVHPALLTLFAERRVLRLVEVEGLAFTDAVFGLLKPGGGPSAIEIRRLVVRDLRPALKGEAMGAWDVELEFSESQRVERARLDSTDGRLRVRLAALKEHWSIEVKASDWTPPLGPRLLFTSLDAKGTATERQIDLPDIKARLYDEDLAASLRVEYSPGWNIGGRFQAKGVDIAPLVKVFAPKQGLGGRLAADGRLSGRAASPDALANTLNVTGKFGVSDGVLHSVDLAGAAAQLVGGSAKGDTRFDQLRGDYVVQGRNVKLRQLSISSGALEAKGNVEITADRRIDGTMDVNLKNTGGIVGMPIALSGSLGDMSVTPTKGSAIWCGGRHRGAAGRRNVDRREHRPILREKTEK